MYKIIIFFVIISLIRGEDYYEVLGISKAASQDEIRKAFKKLAIAFHPDKNNDNPNAHEKFIQITTAYEVLKDDNLRKKYDFYGEDGLNNFHKKQTYHSWSYYDNSFIYEDDQYVISLGRRDYFENIINSDSSWFVNFYSPMCSHCHHLAPTWKKVAKLLDGIVQVAAVNCEYDSQLCYQIGIRSYPTLLYIEKFSQQKVYYTGKRTQEDIVRFALNRLNIHIPKISKTEWELSLYSKNVIEKPILIFICGFRRNCFTFNERLIVTAIFDKLIDVKIHIYEDCDYYNRISYNTRAVYLPIYNTSIWKPVFFNNISDINTLIKKLFDQLPGPQELSDNDFEIIRQTEVDVAWLICFYIGNTTDSSINKFSISDIKLGKINCGRNGRFCNKLGINRYPMWGILKPGGAFELNHGKNTNNNIIKFARIGIKFTNVWALSAEEVLSISRKNNEDIWFLYWYTPLCPSCILLLSEFRTASLKFDKSTIRFGSIDCSIHTMLCRQHNIQYYPTMMLIKGNNIHRFNFRTTTANIIHFINEKINQQVIELTSENFHHKLARKESTVLWIVNYFAPWCGACQRFVSEWIDVAKSLSSLPFVNVASLNCETEASLCTSQGIRFYPTIRLYPLGSEGLRTVGLYNGKYDSLSILTWITRFFPKKIRDLNSVDYESVLDSKHTWIINFYWTHSQKMEAEFAIAAQLLKNVKFGSVNCELYKHKCKHIKVFPSLILYNSKRKNRHNGVKIAATTAETIRDKISEIIHSRIKHDEL